MFKWLRRRREAADRLRKRNDDGESASNPDPLEELVRIVGDSNASGLRPHRSTLASSRRRTPGMPSFSR
jgi:hypothetical protein